MTTTMTMPATTSRSRWDASGALTAATCDASGPGRWVCLVFSWAATGC